MSSLRVLVVDDNTNHAELLADCLQRAGASAAAYDVLTASHADEARSILAEQAVDLAFVDYQLGAVSGLDLIRAIRASGDRRPLIVTTAHGDEYVAAEMIRAGADDYLSKFDLSPERVGQAIDRALERRRADRDASAEQEAAARKLLLLTRRERQVLDHIVAGLMNREIADRMGRSEKTVKIHRANLMKKMEANTAADLVRMVMVAKLGGAEAEAQRAEAD